MAIREEVVRSNLLCAQDLVRDPLFTHRNFFSETVVKLLSETAAFSDSITISSVFALWLEVENESSGQVFGDLKTFFKKALDCRHVVKDTSEQWYALGAVRLPSESS